MPNIIKKFALKDGMAIFVKHSEPKDREGICEFFNLIPKSDLILYRDNISDQELLVDFISPCDEEKVIELIALHKDRVIAKGSLHTEVVYWPKAAEIKLVVSPEYRSKGLGTILFNRLLHEGFKLQVRKIVVRYASGNNSMDKILGNHGFKPESVLNYNVQDTDKDINKNLILASYDLDSWERRFELYSTIYD